MDPIEQFISEKMHGSFYQKLVFSLLTLACTLCGCFMFLANMLFPHLQAIYNFSTWQIALLGSLLGVGSIIGSLVVGDLSNKFGRATVIKMSMFIQIANGTGVYFCNEFFTIAIFFTGIGLFLSLNSLTVTTYVMELSPSKKEEDGLCL